MDNPRILGSKPLLSAVPYEQLKNLEGTVAERPESQLVMLPRFSSTSELFATQFTWNGRPCKGKAIHKAALTGDVNAVRDILRFTPREVTAPFSYHSIHEGALQESLGQAIHLAASRGHLEVVQLLQHHRASLEASVTRGGKDYYDVLHSAIFAEGRADNTDVLIYLLNNHVSLNPDLDGHGPLHVAFSVGSLAHIRLLRKAMRDRGLLKAVEGYERNMQDGPCNNNTPLMLGIEIGRMTEKQLAKAADHTPASLRVFMDHEPRCIPHFAKEIVENREVTGAQIAAHLTGPDLAEVIRDYPKAACILLEGVLETPTVEGNGWHSLPSRVSFAPKGFGEYLLSLLNPAREVLVFYEPDNAWKYDVARFEAPAWHDELTSGGAKPIRDCDIKVCHIPDIIGPEFFSALGDASSEESEAVFKNPVVNGAIEYTWWRGASRVDIMQVVLSLWGLVLLILETYLIHTYSPHHAHARRLRPHGSHAGVAAGDDWQSSDVVASSDFETGALVEISVAADFIGAKGVVDVLHELMQFLGLLCIGRGRDYYRDIGNAFDLFRAAVLMTLFFNRTNQTLRVLVIFICWMRLLDAFTSAEKIAVAFLPIKHSTKGLVPVIIVTLVSFCAFMHAFHFVWGKSHSFHEVFFKSFSTLITTELPANPREKSLLELFLTYSAVIVFSIFIFNIFIGVIGQQYEYEKQRVQVTLRQERSQCCFMFLLRTRIFPCWLCGPTLARVITCFAFLCAIWLQLAGLDDELDWGWVVTRSANAPTKVGRCLFACLQLIMILAQYQNPEEPWAIRRAAAKASDHDDADLEAGGHGKEQPEDQDHRYLWLALPTREECAGAGGRAGRRSRGGEEARGDIGEDVRRMATSFRENW
mmetsp:Transcript_68595/g.173474  ORF Transcript_68595/g.173474 Transcript_68595/m.173474 type:complete len:870 (+) Transcript_68595:63-2672(+)